jgi:hypothetical protein
MAYFRRVSRITRTSSDTAGGSRWNNAATGFEKKSNELFLQLFRQLCTKSFDCGFLLGVNKAAIGSEGIKSRGDCDLVGEQGDTEIAEELPELNQSPQSAESTG